ncbi:MAG: hypothetical protein AB1521_15190 [Bacteroidota bacterium]
MKYSVLLIIFLTAGILHSQEETVGAGNIEIFVIDSYITPETPHKFVLSFFTSDSCKSMVIINSDQYEVSEKYTDNHKFELILDKKADQNKFTYKLIVNDFEGNESSSQLYEVEIPQEMILAAEKDLDLLQVCCFGGIIFGLPSPTLVLIEDKSFFGLSKEIPIFSFYSRGYNYPAGYIGAEYSYIFNHDKKNFLRLGYKHLFQLEFIEYVSTGINYFTDFKGYNGISPELSFGLLQVQNVFTLFARYRYNFQTIKGGQDFHEFSIGLYSNFFSINF